MEFDSPEGIRILEALTAETPRRHSFHPADRQLKFGLRQRHSEFRDATVKFNRAGQHSPVYTYESQKRLRVGGEASA